MIADGHTDETPPRRPRNVPDPIAPGSQNWHQFPISSGVPAFFSHAAGARVAEAGGRELIDLYCGSGTVILGHADPAQLAAVQQVLRSGATVSLRHPGERELAERLVRLCAPADCAAFFKTGSEAVHAAVGTTIRATGRTTILTTSYHGWLLPLGDLGVKSGYEVTPLDWTSPTLVADAAEKADSAACVLVTPTPEMPPAEVVRALVSAVRAKGALVVFDEVKSGFRWSYPTASSALGIDPDLLVVSKAIGNGFPIAALLGTAELLGRTDYFSVFSTYASEIVSVAAALSCLRSLADGAYDRFAGGSKAMLDALTETCTPFGIGFRGVPTFFRFDLPDAIDADGLCRGLFERGVLYHPLDQVLVTAAHTEREIELTCAAFERTLRELGQ